MKIGQFAKKHELTTSTVRFYIELGLLIPQKNGTQYTFTDTDGFEITLIKELKDLGYSLKEMQKYISTVRLYKEQDSALDQSLLPLLREKEHALLQKRDEIDCFLENIHYKITSIKERPHREDILAAKNASPSSVAMPLSFVPMLKCPACGSPLQMEQAAIISKGITGANLECSCGYHAEIRNGMLFTGSLYDHEQDPDFSRCFFGAYKEPSAYDDFFFESSMSSSPELMILQHKAFLYLQEHIRNMKTSNPIIIIPDISCHQLYKLHQEPYIKSALILVLAFTSASIVPIQKYLDGLDLNILYVINHDGLLPFPQKIADSIIDYTGLCNFSFFNSTPFLELFAPYVKENATLLSFTEYYDEHAKSLDRIKETYKFSDPSNMTWKGLKSCLSRCGFELTEKVLLGSCASPGPFWEYHHPDDMRYAVCYLAKKRVLDSCC